MIEAKLEQQIKSIVQSCGCVLYDIVVLKENNKQIFRISITKEHGAVGLDECEEISHIVSPLLDTYEIFEYEYFLEVSSPGIERALKNVEHYRGALGEHVKIKLKGTQKNIQGQLFNADSNKIYIKNKEGETVSIAFEDIQKAMTYFKADS